MISSRYLAAETIQARNEENQAGMRIKRRLAGQDSRPGLPSTDHPFATGPCAETKSICLRYTLDSLKIGGSEKDEANNRCSMNPFGHMPVDSDSHRFSKPSQTRLKQDPDGWP